jgi:hypothetical protein
MMKTLLFIVFLIPLFLSCSNDKARIEFDNAGKTITSVSDEYKILDLLIIEIIDNKESDSSFTSFNFKYPKTKVNLNTTDWLNVTGKPFEQLSKKNLIYRITLEKIKPRQKHKHLTLISFKTADIKNEKQIFESNMP